MRIVGLVAAGSLLAAGIAYFSIQSHVVPEESASFEGDADKLQRTVFVPTLDTPVPDRQSAVWCASFQLAWDKLKSDVVKGSVEITDAKEMCDRLNRASPVAGDLPEKSFYAAAGIVKDGIFDTVRTELARKFPRVAAPEPTSDMLDGILAFAYLEARVAYGHPYRVNPAQLRFPASAKESQRVVSFGIPLEGELDVPSETRDQAGVLFVQHDKHHRELVTFAVDLDRHSKPNQVVLAVIDRKETLAAAVREVEDRIRDFKPDPDFHDDPTLAINDTLVVPHMHWKVRRQFNELCGPNNRLKIDGVEVEVVRAEQTVAFQLDSRGAVVASSAEARVKSLPRHFHFDRPFLIYLKKRDARRPFFVMWVENAELLSASTN